MFKIGDIVEVLPSEYVPDGREGTYQVSEKNGDEYGLYKVRANTPLPANIIDCYDTDVWFNAQRIKAK